jgi:hypothetical protein
VPVPQPHHKWCDTHFKKNGRGKGGGAGLPDKVQAELAVKRKEKMREKFAKMKDKQKAKKAAQKATASLAMPMGPFPFPAAADAPVVDDASALAASSKSTTAQPRYVKETKKQTKKKKSSDAPKSTVTLQVGKTATKLIGKGVLKKKKSSKPRAAPFSALASSIISFNPDSNGSFSTPISRPFAGFSNGLEAGSFQFGPARPTL